MILVRHGQTTYGAEGRFQGCKEEVYLSPLGRKQAEAVGKALFPLSVCSPVFCSPMVRCQQTAGRIYHAYNVLQDLRDVDVGCFAGLTQAEVQERFPRYWRKMEDNLFFWRFPGGESLLSVFLRVTHALKTLPSNAIVVSHEAVLKCMLAFLLGMNPLCYRRLTIDECSITTFDGKRRLVKLNDTMHLREL